MSEQMNVNEQDVKAPSKEQIMSFLAEQIEVKAKQYELQELNTKLAVAKAEELKALQYIAQMTNPQAPANAKRHTLTEEDFQEHPHLSEQGFNVGDEVMVATENSEEEPKKRNLKK
jgi:hypothetical protein